MGVNTTARLQRAAVISIVTTLVLAVGAVLLTRCLLIGARRICQVYGATVYMALPPSKKQRNRGESIRVCAHRPDAPWVDIQTVAALTQLFHTTCQRSGLIDGQDFKGLGMDVVTLLGSPVVGVVTFRGSDRSLWISFRGKLTVKEKQAIFHQMDQRSILIPGGDSRGKERGGEEAQRDGPQVHSGCLDIFLGVLPELETLLGTIDLASVDRICIGGYSMGTSLATLASLYVESVAPGKSCAVLFGGLRFGNPSLKRLLQDKMPGRVMRIVNEDDLVCSFPPTVVPSLTLSASHVHYEYTHVGDACLVFNYHGGTPAAAHRMSVYEEACLQQK